MNKGTTGHPKQCVLGGGGRGGEGERGGGGEGEGEGSGRGKDLSKGTLHRPSGAPGMVAGCGRQRQAHTPGILGSFRV